ncbi:MAG TPA: hypothetical protein VIN93_02350, partial [Bryobacteraceae bacterium]
MVKKKLACPSRGGEMTTPIAGNRSVENHAFSFVGQLGKLRSDCQSDRAAVVNRSAGWHPA